MSWISILHRPPPMPFFLPFSIKHAKKKNINKPIKEKKVKEEGHQGKGEHITFLIEVPP